MSLRSADIRAILVCVDYADLLAHTLPYNRHHFKQMTVVTSTKDEETKKVARENGCTLFETDAFYDDGAKFNKWKALEQGLDAMGRSGWICIMDADVLWPKMVDAPHWLLQGYLYTPLRRMLTQPNQLRTLAEMGPPPESLWHIFPQHPQQREWAGYTQLFHSSDPCLPPAPWHQIDWRHAGGADSFFQQCWPMGLKKRPPFEVLHIGESGQNWCGRATERLDGTKPEEAEERQTALRGFIRGRRHGAPDPFKHEKL